MFLIKVLWKVWNEFPVSQYYMNEVLQKICPSICHQVLLYLILSSGITLCGFVCSLFKNSGCFHFCTLSFSVFNMQKCSDISVLSPEYFFLFLVFIIVSLSFLIRQRSIFDLIDKFPKLNSLILSLLYLKNYLKIVGINSLWKKSMWTFQVCISC